MTTIPLLNIFLYLSAISAVKSSNVEGCDGTKDECNPIIDRTNDSRGLKRYNGTLSEKETKEGWKQIIWSDYKKCKVHELCFDDDRQCKSGWKWKDLKKEKQAVIIDVTKEFCQDVKDIGQIDLEKYKKGICDIGFVIRKEESNCTMLRTQNRCKWKKIGKTNHQHESCEEKEINKPDVGYYPNRGDQDECEVGPGWNGTLDISVDRRSNKINWGSLVKQPSCVYGVSLIHEEAKLEKFCWTTFTDETLPIEYRTNMCKLKIRLHFTHTKKETNHQSSKCYELNTDVRCKDPNAVTRSVIIISVTFIVCAIIIVVVFVWRRRRAARAKSPSRSSARSSVSLDMARNAMYT